MKVNKKALRKIIREQLEIMMDEPHGALGMPHADMHTVQHAEPHEDKVHTSSSDEIGMTVNQLQTIAHTAMELVEMIKMTNHVPEWGQSKVATCLDRLASLEKYMIGKIIGQED